MADDIDNLRDFTAYKLRKLAKQFDRQRPDIARVLRDALQKYEAGEHQITFVDGWPHIVKETFKSAKSAEETEQD